jgi:beta-lactamase regulating signal transducer with metallopeptidase domain
MIAEILTALLVNTAVFTLLFGLMLLFRKLLASRISAALQYMLWAVVVIKLIIPFGFESAISPLNLLQTPAANTGQPQEFTAGKTAALPKDLYLPETETNTAVAENTDAEAPAPAVQPESGSDRKTTPENNTPAPFDWTKTAFAIWLAGTLAAGTVLLALSANLKRRVRHAEVPPSLRVMQIFESCKREVGIKKNIGLIVQAALPAPMVMGFIRPVLVLPEDVEDEGEEGIRHVCMHELTHVRHGDLAVLHALNLLSAVYWFNPLARVCFSPIRRDMETACDNRVIVRIGTQARKDYIKTVLQFTGRTPRENRLYAAIGLADVRMTMEKRIRGMYRVPRTGRAGRITAGFIALIMCALCVLTACRPTPEAPPVVNKADNHLEEMIASSAVSPVPTQAETVAPKPAATDRTELVAALMNKLGAPATYKETYKDKTGNIKVTIDSKVELPAAADFPAIQVKPYTFTQEAVDKFAAYFLKGAPVFTEENVETKEEIMTWIVDTKGKIERAKSHDFEINDKTYMKQLENDLEDYEKKYRDAPEQRKRTPATTGLVKRNEGKFVSVRAELGKDGPASFHCGNQDTGLRGDLSFENDGKGDYYPHNIIKQETEGPPRGMKATLEEAKKTAMQCLLNLGLGDMRVESVEIATFCRDFNDKNDKEYLKTAGQCYQFVIHRMVRGIPMVPVKASTRNDGDDPSIPASPEPDYNYTFDQEEIDLYVDDTGVVRFEWSDPVEEDAVLSEHVDLKKFGDIMKSAKKNMFFKNYGASNTKVHIAINKIRLSMMCIMQKDKPGKYLLVPVWDFIGNREDSYKDGPMEWLPFGDQSYATINAIDGSLINRDWGY